MIRLKDKVSEEAPSYKYLVLWMVRLIHADPILMLHVSMSCDPILMLHVSVSCDPILMLHVCHVTQSSCYM